MKLFFIVLFLPFVLFASNDYEIAKQYLKGQIGAKYKDVKVNLISDCAQDIECLEDFNERNKTSSTRRKTIIDYKNAIKYLEKSFFKGNIRAGKELVNLIQTKQELKDSIAFQKIKQRVNKKLADPNSCYGRYLLADRLYKKDFLNSYVNFKKASSICDSSLLEYKISKRKLELIDNKKKAESMWVWVWFKIKVYVKIFLNSISSLV